jgi:2-deoxy-D-gluconate 3-dehydrogenase
MVESTLKQLGRLDILINNAGMSVRHPAHMLSLDDWHTVIDTNLTSAFICSKAVYPAMKQAGGGKIINIGSMMSVFGASFAPAYASEQRPGSGGQYVIVVRDMKAVHRALF